MSLVEMWGGWRAFETWASYIVCGLIRSKYMMELIFGFYTGVPCTYYSPSVSPIPALADEVHVEVGGSDGSTGECMCVL